AALRRDQVDEITALGVGPAYALDVTQITLELFVHRIELGLEQLTMRFHQLLDVRLVLQIPYVAQLVDLVRADAAYRDVALPPVHVGWRRRQCSQARPGKGDLGGGGEHEGTVRMAGLG